jgi:hypothetical protein
MIKGITKSGRDGNNMKGSAAVTSGKKIIPGSIRAVANLKLWVHYLRHMKRAQRKPVANSINLILVCSYRDQQ